MDCFECGSVMVSKVEKYRYDECGLDNVWLENIPVRRCSNCDDHEVVIPSIEALHQRLAISLVQKVSRLTGPEFRFLRKTLGLSGCDIARKMGVDPSTVSRWERGKTNIGDQSDRLLRVFILHLKPVEDYSLDVLDQMDSSRPDSQRPLTVRHDRGNWGAAAYSP